ncbi:hypothetical protein JXR01_03635 [Candidatus Kaiserbacteria bacterium]|nr:MAG: hypothetical protein JXR01_03635 [Candidatus Kaiserbacteria bacterium]
MNTGKRSLIENISDIVLFCTTTVPFILVWFTSFFCNERDIGNASGSCSIHILSGLYDFLMTTIMVFVYGGFIIAGPILLLFILLSFFTKLLRYMRKQYPVSANLILVEIITFIPVLFALYLFALVFLGLF